jgi:hypothetical protein
MGSPLSERVLFYPILDFGQCFTGALLVELAARSATHSDRTDGDATGHDGHATRRIGDIGQWRLRHRSRRILAQPVGDGFGAVLLTRKRQRGGGVGLKKALSSEWIGAPLPRSKAWRTPSRSTTTAVTV